MITPSFGLTATERVLPKLALDFTTASLDSRITFTRTTSASNPASYVGSNGLIQYASNDQPRFDYDPVTLSCKGLLIEESRTNILTYSSDFSTSWVLSGSTIDSTATTAPDGTLTATKLIEDNGTTTHQIQRTNVFVADGTTRSWTLYVKQGERRYIAFSNGALFSNGSNTLIFDTQDGVWTYGTPATGAFLTTQNAGNGWWRIAFNSASTSGSYDNVLIGLCNGPSDYTAATYTGDGASGLYIWGAQLETGAFPTSYIPTEASAVTRNADVATMTGTNFSDWFNPTEGAFVGEYQHFCTSGTPSALVADDGTAQNMIRLYVVAGTSVSRYAQNIRTLNVAQRDDFIDVSANTTSTVVGVANCYKAADFGGAKNGQAFESQPSGTVPTVNQLRIGHSSTANSTASGWYRKIFYYPQRLINAEVQAFSKV